MRTYKLPKQEIVTFYIDGQIVRVPVHDLEAASVNLVSQGGYLYFVFLDLHGRIVSTVRGGRCEADPEIAWNSDDVTHDTFAIVR